jgi:hypothetical protein
MNGGSDGDAKRFFFLQALWSATNNFVRLCPGEEFAQIKHATRQLAEEGFRVVVYASDDAVDPNVFPQVTNCGWK